MNNMIRRLERLEAESMGDVIEPMHIFVHFIGNLMDCNPTWARVEGKAAISRREDETPEQFEARASKNFPAKPIAVVWMGAD